MYYSSLERQESITIPLVTYVRLLGVADKARALASNVWDDCTENNTPTPEDLAQLQKALISIGINISRSGKQGE